MVPALNLHLTRQISNENRLHRITGKILGKISARQYHWEPLALRPSSLKVSSMRVAIFNDLTNQNLVFFIHSVVLSIYILFEL